MDENNLNRPCHMDNDCCCNNNCGCDEECCISPQVKPNSCKEECCQPAEYGYVDIRKAKCIPILANRIYNCESMKASAMKYLNLDFTITSTPPNGQDYVTGAQICINKIAITYNFLGIPANTLTAILEPIGPVQLNADTCSRYLCTGESATDSSDDVEVFTKFTGTLEPVLSQVCSHQGQKSRLIIQDVGFYVCNLVVQAYGKIGCFDFTASTDPISTELIDLTGIGDGIRNLDFMGTTCLPIDYDCVNLEVKFDGKLDMSCIKPLASYNGTGVFTASALTSLAVNAKEYTTINDELVVYTTPYGVICDDCSHMNNNPYNN